MKRKLEAMEYWDLTTAASLIKGHNNTWVVNNILDVPGFRKVLEDRIVHYPPPGQRDICSRRPVRHFIDKWFQRFQGHLERRANND